MRYVEPKSVKVPRVYIGYIRRKENCQDLIREGLRKSLSECITRQIASGHKVTWRRSSAGKVCIRRECNSVPHSRNHMPAAVKQTVGDLKMTKEGFHEPASSFVTSVRERTRTLERMHTANSQVSQVTMKIFIPYKIT